MHDLWKHPHNITYIILIFSPSLPHYFQVTLTLFLIHSDVILMSTRSIN